MRWTWMAAAAVGLASISAAGNATAQPAETAAQAVDQLLAADRAFSAAGEEVPLVDSLAAMFDENVIMPLPGAKFARGKDAAVAALRENPANVHGQAEWAPVRGGVSADGQHGFSYGFMTIREDGKPGRRAKYLAYWVKRPDGWRVAAYKRAGSGEGMVATALRPPSLPAQRAPVSSDAEAIAAHRQGLVAAEQAFSDRAQQIGLGPAFVEYGAPDAMNMGPGADFTYGNDAIGGVVDPDRAPTSPVYWASDYEALVAPSGDLGITFGTINLHEPSAERPNPAYSFFTIWRRAGPDEPWRYVAE